MADLSLRCTTRCLGCDGLMPNAALDAVLCASCLTAVDELGLDEPIEGPAAPRGHGPDSPGPDDEDVGDLL